MWYKRGHSGKRVPLIIFSFIINYMIFELNCLCLCHLRTSPTSRTRRDSSSSPPCEK